ncbi:MAG: hypothetical protein IJM37_05375 [Lachnospiraceae bacterium]|nr:hypothetical protein [Lachnospiraceae bacterium]
MKEKFGNLFVKLIVLLLIFTGVIGLVLFFNKDDKSKEVYAQWSDAKLPVVYMNFEEGRINCLHGYTEQMDIRYMRDTVTPVPLDRTVNISVETFGSSVSDITYEVYSQDGSKLYIKKKLEDYDGTKSQFDASFTLEDIFDKATEYQLVLTVSTQDYREIYYYTRLRYYDDTNISGILKYVRDFSTQALSGEMANEYVYQLESDEKADNSSFGFVNIKSRYSHVRWGNLKPQLISDVNVSIKDFNQMTGSVMLEYRVSALDENDKTIELDVDEFFCVRYINSSYYLIAYERQANQEFNFTEDSINNTAIEFGIVADRYLPMNIKSKGRFNAFAADGELWGYDSGKNSAIKIFSFKQNKKDIRTQLDEHEFDILLADDDKVLFTVAGYMNSGFHEGECGLCFYNYDRKENSLSEVFFIPSKRPYEVVCREAGKMTYMSEKGVYYIVFNGCLYSIDFDGMEYVKITDGLREGGFCTDKKNGIIAWHEDGGLYEGTIIREMFLNDGSEFFVNADEGEYVRLLGFLDGDMIVGRTFISDVTESMGVVNYPMYKFEIINKEHKKETQYRPNGYYISGIVIENERIIVQRLLRSEDGSLVKANDDVLLKNWEEEDTGIKLASEIDDIRKKVYSLKLNSVSSSKKFSVIVPEIPGSSTSRLSLAAAEEKKNDERYYAYSCGHLEGITDSVTAAIALIYDDMGVVVDSSQRYIWTRANRSVEKTIQITRDYTADDESQTVAACLNTILSMQGKKTDAASQLERGRTSFEILNDALDNNALDLKGCILNQVIYYVNNNSPVMVYTGNNKAELIVGFVGSSQVKMYDPLRKEVYTIPWQQAENLFSANGNNYISFIK